MTDKPALYAEAASLFKQAVAEGAPEPEARAAYDAAVSRIAAMPDPQNMAQEGPASASGSPQTPQNAPGVGQGILENLKGAAGRVGGALRAGGDLAGAARGDGQALARVAANPVARGLPAAVVSGATWDMADDVVEHALPQWKDGRVVLGDPQMAEGMRQAAGDFAKASPLGSFSANVAGGVLSGKALQSLGAKAIPYLSRAANVANKSSIAQGALAGYGSGESETIGGKVLDAAVGGATGGVIGGVAGLASGAVAKLGQRLSQGQAPALPFVNARRRAASALAKRAERSQTGVDGWYEAGAKNTAKDARLFDNLGAEGERLVRGIRTQGGEAGERVNNTLANRMRNYQDRITDAIYSGRNRENITELTDDIIARRKAASAPLYKAFRAEPPVYDPDIEDLLSRPLFAEGVVPRAERSLKNMGKKSAVITLGGSRTASVRTPEFLDKVKKALDDKIYKGRQPGEGGMGPEEMGEAKALRQQFIGLLDKRFVNYAPARQAWAGEAALKDALEEGADLAKGGKTPEQLAKLVATKSPDELDMLRRGWLDHTRQRVSKGGMRMGETDRESTIRSIEALFGDEAPEMLTRIRDEVETHRAASRVVGGSQTKDKEVELFSELFPEQSGLHLGWAQATPRKFLANTLDRIIERKGMAPLGQQTRSEAAKMMLSKGDDFAILDEIAKELKARDAFRSGREVGPRAAAAGIETSYGFFRAPRDERGNRR